MGITLSAFGGLFSPLQGLMEWFVPRAGQPLRARPVVIQTPAPRGRIARPATAVRPCERTRRPLRVVRVVEGAGAGASAGRMFISGRMADVCAELDRLAALEAAAG